MIRKFALAAFLVLFIGAPAGWAAKVYHWVDSQGNVHFGDVPHDGANSIKVRVWKPKPQAVDKATEPSASAAGAAHGDNMTPQQQCKLAHKQYRKYKDADKLVEVNQFGEKHTLDKSQRAKALAQAKANVSKYCSG